MDNLARRETESGDILSDGESRSKYEPVYRKPWYQDIVEFFLMNPGSSITDCARYLKKDRAYIAQLLRSDMMRAHMAKARRDRMALINDEVTLRAGKTLITSLKIIDEKLAETPREKLKMADLNETASNLLNALGFAPKANTGNATAAMQVNIQIGGEMLARAREKMEAAQVVDVLKEPAEGGQELGGEFGEVTSESAFPEDMLDDLYTDAPTVETGPTTMGQEK